MIIRHNLNFLRSFAIVYAFVVLLPCTIDAQTKKIDDSSDSVQNQINKIIDAQTKKFADVSDSMQNQIYKIERHTDKTMENTSKDSYYWILFGVSVLTLCVAGWTLRSQIKTEKNTRRWSLKQERFVLRSYGTSLMNNISSLLVLEYYNKHRLQFLPKPYTFEDMKIRVSDLHLEEIQFLYPRLYENYKRLYYELINYNEYLERCKRFAEDPSTLEINEQDFIIIIQLMSSIGELYSKTLTLSERIQRWCYFKIRMFITNTKSVEDCIIEITKPEKIIFAVDPSLLLNNNRINKLFSKQMTLCQRNLYSNIALAWQLSNEMAIPKLCEYNFWAIYRVIMGNYTYVYSNNEVLKSVFDDYNDNNDYYNESAIYKITTESFEIDLSVLDLPLPKIPNIINEEQLKLIKQLTLFYSFYTGHCRRNNTTGFYQDEVQKYTYTTENGGTLIWLDAPRYKYIIQHSIYRNINVDFKEISSMTILENVDNYKSTLDEIKNLTSEEFPYILKPINRFVCTNNEPNGRTMISEFSVNKSYVEKYEEEDENGNKVIKWRAVIELGDHLSLKIV